VDADRHSKMHRPSGRLVARREWGARFINSRNRPGDSRAEATLISGVIVLCQVRGVAIDLCERGIPRKYWSARPVAEKVRKWEELGSSRVEEGMLVGCVMGVGECVGVQCVFG